MTMLALVASDPADLPRTLIGGEIEQINVENVGFPIVSV
jgi:hypothetical protein